MALIAIEAQAKGIRWTDGQAIGMAKSLGELLDQLDRPHAVICEPALFDEHRDVRRHLEAWLAERGHRLVPVSPPVREILEAAGGARVRGRGVVRLFELATIGPNSLGLAGRAQHLFELRDTLQVAHLVDLSTDRPAVLEQAARALGPYDRLELPAQAALGDGCAYRTDVLLAAYRTASVATSRDMFERLLGLNGAAHGPLTQTIRAWYVERNTDGQFVRESALSWADYRRALRMIFHRVSEQRRLQLAA